MSPDSSEEEGEKIVWKYLSFDSELPSPAWSSTAAGQDTLPQPPDLSSFTSPFAWSAERKRFTTYLSCTVTMFTSYGAGAYSSAIDPMMSEWQVSRVALLVGITTFTVGFGIAPMFLAPFSEINGRRPVFVVTGVLWVVFQLVCAVTPTFGGMLAARFLVGCTSSTFATMVGGVISDIYHAEERNTGMTLYSGAVLFGTGLGPLVSGFIAQDITWRWIFWLQVIVDGVLIALVIAFFAETRGSVLLSRKVRALNRYYERLESAGCYGVLMPEDEKSAACRPQRIRWKCKSDEERGSLLTMIRTSLWRPVNMLVTEPVVFFFSLWVSFAWAILYMTFSAIPLIFQTTYGFDLQDTGAVFACVSIASIIFTVLAIVQDKLGLRYLPASQRALLTSPEGRLYFTCVESTLLPIGLLWFAIAGAYASVPWIVPMLGIGAATMGIFSIYLAVFNYLADAYHRHASSALAAQSFCRNMLAGAFPLFSDPMFNGLSFPGAGGLLGGIGFLLTIVPWVLLLYGPRIRSRSKLAGEIVNASD